jgi:PAS domain S-box-containing protein
MSSAADYPKLAQSASVGVMRLSDKFDFLEANDAVLRMLEVDSLEELRKLNVFDIVPPESLAIVRRETNQRGKGFASTYETVLIGRRGTRRNIIISSTPLMTDGVLTGVFSTYVDITDLRNAESALRVTVERYRAVVTSLAEGIAIISQSGELSELNPSAQKILGPLDATPSIHYMRTGWIVRDEQGRQLSPEELPAAITLVTGKPCRDVMLEMQRPDGSQLWININTQPLFYPDQESPYGCVASFHDVTPLKKANDDLRQREQQLNRLLDAFPDNLFVLSADGVFLDYRTSHPDRLFQPPENFLGKNFAELLPPEVVEPNRKVLQRALATGRTESVEYSTDIFGEIMYFETRATRLDEKTVLMLVRNTTKDRQAEQRLRQQEQEVAHLARLGALGEMVAGISHEINQPLHAIANYAAASLNKLESNEENAKEQVDAWLRKIASQAFRASEIVKRFRQFSSPTTRTSTVSVAELIQEALELVAGEVRKRNVQVDVRNLAGDVSFVVDRIQLQQVLVNLLVNACEAVEGNATNARKVVVLTKIEHGKLVCEVADNGVGLPNVSPSQLFDAFYTTKPSGLGLGLPISRTIIEALGGRIWARHNSPRGSVFGFEIPKAARPKSEAK